MLLERLIALIRPERGRGGVKKRFPQTVELLLALARNRVRHPPSGTSGRPRFPFV